MVNAQPTPEDREHELMLMNSFTQGMFFFKNRVGFMKLMSLPRNLLNAEMRALESRALLVVEIVWRLNQGYWIGRIFEESADAEMVRQAISEIEDLRKLISEEFQGFNSRLFN
jgi:hypothetical protein